jgi:hypothetical protein
MKSNILKAFACFLTTVFILSIVPIPIVLASQGAPVVIETQAPAATVTLEQANAQVAPGQPAMPSGSAIVEPAALTSDPSTAGDKAALTGAQLVQKMNELMAGSLSAWSFRKILNGYTQTSLTPLIANQSSRNQTLLRMLVATNQRILPDYITDAGLQGYMRDSRKFDDMLKPFDSTYVKDHLDVLEKLDADKAAKFILALAQPYSEGSTWAAGSWCDVIRDVRLYELARRSTVAKVLMFQGKLSVPGSTTANFAWSGAPSITMNLPPVYCGWADYNALLRLKTSSNAIYKAGALKALTALNQLSTQAKDPNVILAKLKSTNSDERCLGLQLLTIRGQVPSTCLATLRSLASNGDYWVKRYASQILRWA